MHAVVVVWVVWIVVVLALAAAAVVLAPRLHAPRRWAALRSAVTPVVEESVTRFGRVPTAVLIYLLGAATIVAVCWPLGLLAHALQGTVDEPAFSWFQGRQLGNWSDVWWKLTNIGSPALTQQVTAVAAVFFAVVWAVRGLAWWLPLGALPLGYCLEKYTQIVIQDVVHRGHPPTTHGTFPSGGCGRVLVVYGMVIFMTVLWLWPRSRRMWAVGWGLLACLLSIQAYARIYNLEHWLTDVIGGTVFGVLLIAVMASCLRVLHRAPSASGQLRAVPLSGSDPAVGPGSSRRQVGTRPSSAVSRSS